MPNDTLLSPVEKLKWACMLFQAARAESKGHYGNAIRLLDEAATRMPLWAPERVQRAVLLLKQQRTREAQEAFSVLRSDFKGSHDPDLQYLWHHCTGMLSLMSPSSSQWTYEANQAEKIECKARLKKRFPMITADEI